MNLAYSSKSHGWLTITSFFLMITVGSKLFSQDSMNVELQKKIYEVYLTDQECRENLREFKNRRSTDQDSLFILEKRISFVDSLNYFILSQLIETYSFPGYDQVGKDFSDSFWNLVQHQDAKPEFQQQVLVKMKAEVDKKNATGMYYAYLLDRVKVNAGELQIYGSQMQLNSDSTSYEPKPVVDPGNLDKRRAEVGLPPMKEYVEQMNLRYFGTIKKE